MKLLIDIGNSRTKYCFEHQGKLTDSESIPNAQINSAWLAKTFNLASAIFLASVSNQTLTQLLTDYGQQRAISVQIVESEKSHFGVTSCYAQPATLGVDRWLAMLGSTLLFPNETVLIIDAGTATTVDLVDHSGVHCGGWILPGIETLFSSVVSSTTKVQASKLATPTLSFGINTSECVNHACWAATKGLIDQAIVQAKLVVELDKIILTGGNAPALSHLLTAEHQVIEALVFHGMRCYSSKNS